LEIRFGIFDVLRLRSLVSTAKEENHDLAHPGKNRSGTSRSCKPSSHSANGRLPLDV
jgi:hypothetical protein